MAVDLTPFAGDVSLGPTPQVTAGNVNPVDWNLIAMMLGQGAQAFSASDPTSWQHGVGGLASNLARSKKYSEAASKARTQQRSQTQALIDLLAPGATPAGTPGITGFKVGKAGEGKLPELTLSLTPELDAFDSLFGKDVSSPLSTGRVASGAVTPTTGAFEPEEPSPGLGYGGTPRAGGAGGQSATHPFMRLWGDQPPPAFP